MRRSFKRAPFARRGARPSRVWADVSGQWLIASATGTTTATLIRLEAPANLSNLTADPPEDMTVLRIRGSFACSLSGGPANWTLALTVQDTLWTPQAQFTADADKRILWAQTFATGANVAHDWRPPGWLTVDPAGTPRELYSGSATVVDIAPKVKLEAGKALYLVAYENSGAVQLSTESWEMRVLFQRSGRPR